jgi:SAM-dependent methyltransferase
VTRPARTPPATARTPTFPPDAFRRIDEDDDARFYAVPRRVVHIDEGAIAALAAVYAAVLPRGGHLLDLMASWRSHLPPGLAGRVTGLGLNREEMLDNPQLDAVVVHDLNREPALPFPEHAFDAVACAVSVQYLTRPVEVFAAVRRALRPGAPFVVAFSNRCFPQKAVALWQAATDEQHVEIVRAYFAGSGGAEGGWGPVQERAEVPGEGDPLFAVWACRAPSGSAP